MGHRAAALPRPRTQFALPYSNAPPAKIGTVPNVYEGKSLSFQKNDDAVSNPDRMAQHPFKHTLRQNALQQRNVSSLERTRRITELKSGLFNTCSINSATQSGEGAAAVVSSPFLMSLSKAET